MLLRIFVFTNILNFSSNVILNIINLSLSTFVQVGEKMITLCVTDGYDSAE